MPRPTLVLPLLLLLAGCATAPMPLPEGYSGPVATIVDTYSQVSDTKLHFFELARVDGRTVETSSELTYVSNRGRGFAMDPVVESRNVPALESVFLIRGVTHVAADILAFGGRMFHVEGEVRIKLKPSGQYYVRGVLTKDYRAVWVEDQEGNIASDRVEAGDRPDGPIEPEQAPLGRGILKINQADARSTVTAHAAAASI